jgi:hypothetical protein
VFNQHCAFIDHALREALMDEEKLVVLGDPIIHPAIDFPPLFLLEYYCMF